MNKIRPMKQLKTPEFLEKLRPFIEWAFRGPILFAVISVAIAVSILSGSWTTFLLYSLFVGAFAYTIKDTFKSKK